MRDAMMMPVLPAELLSLCLENLVDLQLSQDAAPASCLNTFLVSSFAYRVTVPRAWATLRFETWRTIDCLFFLDQLLQCPHSMPLHLVKTICIRSRWLRTREIERPVQHLHEKAADFVKRALTQRHVFTRQRGIPMALTPTLWHCLGACRNVAELWMDSIIPPLKLPQPQSIRPVSHAHSCDPTEWCRAPVLNRPPWYLHGGDSIPFAEMFPSITFLSLNLDLNQGSAWNQAMHIHRFDRLERLWLTHLRTRSWLELRHVLFSCSRLQSLRLACSEAPPAESAQLFGSHRIVSPLRELVIFTPRRTGQQTGYLALLQALSSDLKVLQLPSDLASLLLPQTKLDTLHELHINTEMSVKELRADEDDTRSDEQWFAESILQESSPPLLSDLSVSQLLDRFGLADDTIRSLLSRVRQLWVADVELVSLWHAEDEQWERLLQRDLLRSRCTQLS